MKALVTGGCGFIGSHLVHRLLREGVEVSILDTFFTGHPSRLGDAYQDCAVLQGNVTNWDAVRRAMQGAHIVYHLAARMDWTDKDRHPARLFNTNTMGTTWVLTMARAMGVQRVIFASSAAVYGNLVPGFESASCIPCSVYGASKLAAEAACHAFNALGLETVTLRLFNVYGSGGHGVYDLFQNGSNVIYGDGSQSRDFIHVSDVVNAMIAAQKWDGGIYNVGTGIETTIAGLWHKLRGGEEPEFKSERMGDIYRSYADTTKTDRLWKARKRLI